jgi:hypothetical protein
MGTGKVMTRHQRKMMTCNTIDNENLGFVRERVRQQWENLEEQLATPEPILRQQGKVVRPQWCTCLDGFWMRALIDPQCHYHGDYGYELRDFLDRERRERGTGQAISLPVETPCSPAPGGTMSDNPEQSVEFLLGRLANEQETNRKLRALLARTTDALQDLDRFAFYCWSARNEKFPQLIAELRKAAE